MTVKKPFQHRVLLVSRKWKEWFGTPDVMRASKAKFRPT